LLTFQIDFYVTLSSKLMFIRLSCVTRCCAHGGKAMLTYLPQDYICPRYQNPTQKKKKKKNYCQILTSKFKYTGLNLQKLRSNDYESQNQET